MFAGGGGHLIFQTFHNKTSNNNDCRTMKTKRVFIQSTLMM